MNTANDLFSEDAENLPALIDGLDVYDQFDELRDTFERPLAVYLSATEASAALQTINSYYLEQHRHDPDVEGMILTSGLETEGKREVAFTFSYTGDALGSISFPVRCVRGPDRAYYLFGDEEFMEVLSSAEPRLS